MQNFSPFPLRARGSLEIFDAAIKLYKQYFWVLLGWSAIVSGAGIFGAILPFGGMAALFLAPLSIGSVVCCLAAAVRGQNVEFGQCWRFTQPRYWIMLGMHLLTLLIAFAVLAVLAGICTGLVIAGAFAFQASSLPIQITMGVLAFLIFGFIFTVIGTVIFAWMSLVPIVVCMEEDKRGTMALGRAFDILRGHWLRITVLMAVVGMAMMALLAILSGAAALVVGIGQITDLIQGRGEATAALWLGVAAMGLAYIILAIAGTPLYYLILAVFYLGVRVRQEALDLEWTAHVTAPPMPTATPEYSAPEIQPLTPAFVPAPDQFGTRILSDAPTDFPRVEANAFEPQENSPTADNFGSDSSASSRENS